MDEFEKITLARTKQNVLCNLERINNVIEGSELPLNDHMVLDDIKDSVKILKYLKELGACGGETVAAKASKAIPGMV